ncbi:MAG TPA: chitobiase/beta-hexosaminidase C-terminal domain-containing protein, partial [Vicinamibacteria bacterium]
MKKGLAVSLRAAAVLGGLLALPSLASAATIAAGYYHTVVRASDGHAWAWGYNGYGQLGDGTTTQRNVPVQVTGLTNVTAVAAGIYHTLALTSDGKVWAWGYNGYGQLGDNSLTSRSTPAEVLSPSTDPPWVVTAIAAGEYFSLALDSNGTVWAWGLNSSGQLGDGSTLQRNRPVQVASFGTGLTATAIAAGGTHALAVVSDGTVRAWGANWSGQLGNNTWNNTSSLPVTVVNSLGESLSGVSKVEAGSNFSLALMANQTVRAWGYNGYGQLGDGTVIQRITPVTVTGLSSITALGAGYGHSLAVKSDGMLFAWGYNGTGQLGDGSTLPRSLPFQLSLTAVQEAAGGKYVYGHSAAVTTDGTVWTWGYNYYGQIGDGTAGASYQRNSPVQISESSFNWIVGTPMLSPQAGTYNANQTVTVTCATSGAEIHYTTNGATPTTSDPTVASGSTISVTQSLTLKAKAWKGASPSSNVATEVYTLKVANPTFSPAAGTYTSA